MYLFYHNIFILLFHSFVIILFLSRQHCLLLPLDLGSHPHHWLLFDRVIQQIVLQTEEGKDLDAAPLQVDVKGLVHLLADEEALLEARARADELERENQDISNRLAKVLLQFVNLIPTFIPYRLFLILSNNKALK